MNREEFVQWVDRIYATADAEIDCEQLQLLLPRFVEFESAGGDPANRFAEVLAHLAQCPDCAEEYQGLREVVALEAQGRLPEAEQILAQFSGEAVLTSESPSVVR